MPVGLDLLHAHRIKIIHRDVTLQHDRVRLTPAIDRRAHFVRGPRTRPAQRDQVVATARIDLVRPRTTIKRVVATQSVDYVVTALCVDVVRAVRAGDCVISIGRRSRHDRIPRVLGPSL